MSKKSGLHSLKTGEVLFNDGDHATSLYIIQRGQLRLFKPKGKGFVEIAVLRVGEVIGEMAYFDDGGGKRSCSASAMVPSDVIEISFSAFAKTMSGLNPWFKTIINTLAKRLRQTNARVKELESNSASVSYGSGKHSGYKFFKPNDIIRILGTLFLVYKAHGEKHVDGLAIHRNTLSLYSHDIFGVMESKLDEMTFVLKDLGLFKIVNDKEGQPKIFVLRDLDKIRAFFIFYNTEKHLTDEKKLRISPKCQTFLERIWEDIKDVPNRDEAWSLIPVSEMLEYWKERKEGITVDNLEEARFHGITGEVIVNGTNDLSLEVSYSQLSKSLPNIQFMNRIQLSNKAKSAHA